MLSGKIKKDDKLTGQCHKLISILESFFPNVLIQIIVSFRKNFDLMTTWTNDSFIWYVGHNNTDIYFWDKKKKLTICGDIIY